MPENFAHLHVHTEYSMLDGAAQLSPLFAEAQRLGQPALALTDHGNMFGAHSFYTQATKTGVKPILGIEAYVAPGARDVKKPVRWGRPDQRGDDVSGSGSYTHMTMLARNVTGLRNLFKLSSVGSIEGYYYKPRMDRELIAGHAEGIIATTGCPGGEVQTRLRLGQPDEALRAAADYRDIFGPDNFYLEIMEHGNSVERRVAEELADLAKKLNLPPLVTNDSHYVVESQASDHAALLCVQSGSRLDDPNRFKFEGSGYFLRSADQMRALRSDEMWAEGCRNTLVVAEAIEPYTDVFAHADRMPVFAVPEGHTAESWLAHEVNAGLQRLFPSGVPEPYRQRAEYELGVITGQGYPGYFLVVADLIAWAKTQGIRVGPGRGSAVGSLVAYATGITGADPLEHGLLFERFLNPERVSMPDIDIDFDDRRRVEVIQYVADKYGADKIAQVITFGTIKAKAALKDAARILHGPEGFSIADKISKAMPPAAGGKDIPLKGIVDTGHDRYAEAVEVRGLLESDAASKQIFDTARGLEGLIRQAGVHACAVIMSSEPITDVIPVWARPQDGAIITGFDYPSCEDIGLLKMDFLGLRNLTVIGDALGLIKSNRGLNVDLDAVPMNDPAAYRLLGNGETLGVFQLDGGAMRELLRRMKPTSFRDVIAVIALYRPGPMGVNAHNDYADRKNARQDVTAIHPELAEPLKDILAETYGLIVYQEQIMLIAQAVAGFTPGQADVLRKAMGKKKLDVLEEQFALFENGMKTNGFSTEAVKVLWDTILPFAGYAFNKSHAVGYGLVAYWTAYLKAIYPAEYMAALLTSVGDSKDRMAMYLAECRKLGISVLSPDVNESANQFAAVGGDVRFGLAAVRNVGANVVSSIVNGRNKKGKYDSFTDFLSKVDANACNKRSIESLIKAGAFDSLGHPRAGLAQIHATAVDAVMNVKKHEAQGQFDLFGDLTDTDPALTLGADVSIPDHEWDPKEKLGFERDMLGLYVSAHPLDGYEHLLSSHRDNTIATLVSGEISDGKQLQVSGILTAVEKRVTKKGKLWAKATLEDLDAAVEVCFFPQTFELVGDALTPDLICAIRGKTDARDGATPQLIAHDISPLDTTSATPTNTIELRIRLDQVTEDLVDQLANILTRHPGESTVHIRVKGEREESTLQLPDKYRTNHSTQLIAELKALIGTRSLALIGRPHRKSRRQKRIADRLMTPGTLTQS